MTTVESLPRTVYAVVNTSGSIGAMEWRDDRDNLPSFGAADDLYVVTVPGLICGACSEANTDDNTECEAMPDARHAWTVPDAARITDELEALLGGYHLPDGWEYGPVR